MSGTELTVSWFIPSLLIEIVGVESLESVELSFPMSATISITAESLNTDEICDIEYFGDTFIIWLMRLNELINTDYSNNNNVPVFDEWFVEYLVILLQLDLSQ